MRPAILALLAATLLLPHATAQDGGPTEVDVGLLVINFGNYDANKGTYTLDFYLVMRWDADEAPAGFTPEKFEFMNGRATAKDKITDTTDNETNEREVWYRIQASLYSEPHFEDFPFDTQVVQIELEDSIYTTSDLVYKPLADFSGIDEGFRAAGWNVHEPTFTVSEKHYKFDETYSRLKFSVDLSRERFSTAIKSLLPPVAFLLVAGLAFFLHPSKWGNRIGLGTGMLISAVMFHISQTVALPPMAKLIFFDKVMIAVYLFVLGSLAVTALIAIDEDYWKDRDYTKQINGYGAAATILLSGATMLILLI